MTKVAISTHRFIGASTDTKDTGVPIGSTWYEYDTGKLYITYDGDNWAVKGDGGRAGDNALFSTATGAAAISKTLAPGAKFRLLRIELHLSAAPTTSENFTVDLDAGDGGAYDVNLHTEDLSAGSITDLLLTFGEGYEYEADDEIDIAYDNTDEGTYGLRIEYELI